MQRYNFQIGLSPLLMRGVVAAAAVVLVAGVPVARADTPDQHYLAAVAAAGVQGAPADLIADGRQACDNYGTAGLVGQTMALEGQGMSAQQASAVILAGVRTYCPEKAPGV